MNRVLAALLSFLSGLTILIISGQAYAWESAWAIRENATLTPRLELGIVSVVPVTTETAEVNGYGANLSVSLDYIDDDKMATLEIGSAEYYMIWRTARNRFDTGGFPTLRLFDLRSQVRALPHLHILYGAGLMRSGAMNHASTAGLSFHFGFALPLIGSRSETMRDYQQSYLQIETTPLAGSLLADIETQGFFDQEPPTVQLFADLALSSRIVTLIGVFSGELRLSSSYLHQRSMYLRGRLRFSTPTFLRRIAGVVTIDYTLPIRPLRVQMSEDAQVLLYDQHLSISLGLIVFIRNAPRGTTTQRRITPLKVRRQRRTERRNRRRRLRQIRRSSNSSS